MEKRTVSLALGAGGARGYAHIGVITWLNDHGFNIRSIAGSSMGALIGGLYAAGQLDNYTEWVRALQHRDVLQLLDLSFGSSGLFKGERVIQTLRDLTGDYNIEDLPLSFTAVTTDLDAEKEVWLSKGPLFDAIRASIATPTLFTPFHYKGRRLVDGGLVNPLPIAPTLRDMTDITIAVNLSGREEPDLEQSGEHVVAGMENRYTRVIREFIEELLGKKPVEKETAELGMFDVISQSLDTMQNGIARLKLASYSPDIIIDIPKNACYFHEFHRADHMIELGWQRAEKALTHQGVVSVGGI
ncbi:MAG: patatin-like phospholipase family protein [Gammaproteobacteria bacterium]